VTLNSQPDENPEDVFTAVGYALSCWEFLEAHLADLYSIFQGKPLDVAELIEFGVQGKIFVDRVVILERSAAKYFASRPNQEHEGALSGILRTARALSHTRHQLAHGIVGVVPVYDPDVKDEDGWVWPIAGYGLVAPLYAAHRLRKGNFYIHTSASIVAFAEQFGAVSAAAETLSKALTPKA